MAQWGKDLALSLLRPALLLQHGSSLAWELPHGCGEKKKKRKKKKPFDELHNRILSTMRIHMEIYCKWNMRNTGSGCRGSHIGMSPENTGPEQISLNIRAVNIIIYNLQQGEFFSFLFFFFFCVCFLGPNSRHMEVPRLGV